MSQLGSTPAVRFGVHNFQRRNLVLNHLGRDKANTTRPDKHGRVFLAPLKRDLTIVRVCTPVIWTSHFLEGTRNTRPCLTGHPVREQMLSLRWTI